MKAHQGVRGTVAGLLSLLCCWAVTGAAAEPSPPQSAAPLASSDELQVEVTKKGLGKEVVMRKGTKEWYMLIEVTEGMSVVIRQEKEGDAYIVDESETHDEAFSKSQVDAAIEAFIASVRKQTERRESK
jgi:hypothetical protein